MGSPLQRSPSGDPFDVSNPVAANPGDIVPVYSPTLKDFVAGTLPSGGAGVPLSNVFFVDGNTVVPGADQDGSIGAPYSEIQDAVDAHPTCALYVTSGFTYADLTLPDESQVQILALGGASLQIGDVVLGDNCEFSLIGRAECGNIVTGTGCLVLITSLGAPPTIAALAGNFTLGDNSNVNATGIFALGSITGGAGTSFSGRGFAADTSSVGAVTADSIEAVGLNATSLTTNETGGATVLQCTPGNLAIGGQLRIDLFSLNRVRQAASTLVFGTEIIEDAPTVTISPFTFPVFAAPGVQNVPVAFPDSHQGDTFAAGTNGATGIVPADVVIGNPRCEVAGTVLIPIACPTTSAGGASCDLLVTRLTVSPL